MNEIEKLGWKKMDIKYPLPKGRVMYEKGNYWLGLDTGHYHGNQDYITITVRDPAFEDDKTGSNITQYHFAFVYKGKQTIDCLEMILNWDTLWSYQKRQIENESSKDVHSAI